MHPGDVSLDADGDTWTCVSDSCEKIHDEPAAETRLATDAQAERLERIATAALQGWLASPNTARTALYTEMAQQSVACAKALIAELDRQS